MSRDDDDQKPTQADIRKLLNSIPTYHQRRVGRIFRGTTWTGGRGAACRVCWEGPLMANGTIPPVIDTMGRRTERRRAVYRLRYGFVARAERIVAVCGSDRCLDHRHMRVIPLPKPPKPPRPSRAKVPAIVPAVPAATTA